MGAAEKLNSAQIADRLDELPTLPTIVYELSRVINDPMSSTGEVEEIMSNDQSLTAKVLKLANSAYYAIPGGVTSLQRAIAYIGYDAINQLVLSTSIIKTLGASPSKNATRFEPKEFWKHSLGVAMASETIAKLVRHRTPADLFICGLVHDIGKIAMHMIAPEVFSELLEHAAKNALTIEEAESALGTAKHTLIGRDLAAKWRLPAVFQATVAFHHQKEPARRTGLSQELNQVVDVVFLANLLVHALHFGNSGHSKIAGVPRDVLERLHLSQEDLKSLIEKVKNSLASVEAFLKIIDG